MGGGCVYSSEGNLKRRNTVPCPALCQLVPCVAGLLPSTSSHLLCLKPHPFQFILDLSRTPLLKPS